MKYMRLNPLEFYSSVTTEQKAQDLIWRIKFRDKDFQCPKCSHDRFYQFENNSEIRKCRKCQHHVRLRAGTIFEHSKTPLLTWEHAIFHCMQGTRGISALELQRLLKMKSYRTTWTMLHKIREALRQRDLRYKLNKYIELDGAAFGRKVTGNQVEVLVAIETKDWIDAKGRPKSKAGFAKVMIGAETKQNAQNFVNENITGGAMINTDGSPSLINLTGVDVDYRVVGTDKEILDHWLPWVHKFIGNAKVWLLGTHHGVDAKYLGQYLAEYTYRFNRRHDPDSLFSRALAACVLATPTRSGTLLT
jgi:transposase-like protein